MKSARLLFCMVVTGAGITACSDFPQDHGPHDPLAPEEHVTLGLRYEGKAAHELAAREYRMALRQAPEYVPALMGLGNLAFAQGALDESETYYRQALAVSPEHPGANNNLAMLYLTRDSNLQEAEQLALRALKQGGPLHPYILITLAHLYSKQGRYKEAVEALEGAEETAPMNDPLLHDRLIKLRDHLVRVRYQVYRRTVGPSHALHGEQEPGHHPRLLSFVR